MARNKISDLRDHLFETLEALKDEEKPMEIARAKAIAEVAGVVIESAKVEVDFLRVTGGLKSTGFLPEDAEADPPKRALRAVNESKR